MSEKYELSDVTASNSRTNLTMPAEKQNGGCYVSAAIGFVLVLLAVVLAVGVGIIVHFAGNDKELVCNCGGEPSVGGATADAIKDQCVDMANSGDSSICQACPGQEPPGTSTTASSSSAVGETTTSTTEEEDDDPRLPLNFYPLHYELELQPNMYLPNPDDFYFKGSVKIQMRCDKPSNVVTLHSNKLNISELTFTADSMLSNEPRYLSHSFDTKQQFLLVQLSFTCKVNNTYSLAMKFRGPLTGDLAGLYLSTYMRGNKTIYAATSQLQATDARKTFPCFDEPGIKATFKTTIVRPDYLISISNMLIYDQSETFVEDGITYVKDKYNTTPSMSTYLLAFIVSDFKYLNDTTKNGVLYRAWATPESVNQAQYALEVGVNVLTYFEEWFAVPYPLPKQDMVAVPDFSAGAMENWGLIIYRETAMLYEQGISNEANKERVAVVVSHELAHQWFGNLVTPDWWDGLWLNEGFASFVEYMGVDYHEPEWKMFETFVVEDMHEALGLDGLVSSHPVYVPVKSPDEISEIFDTISYAKGASILRMMRHFLGLTTFQKGLTRYLEKKKYQAAFQDDLWAALTEQAAVDGVMMNGQLINVKEVMDTWTLQMNYPVVTATRDFYQHGVLHLTQERYLQDPTAEDPLKFVSPFDYKWNIPLTFTSSKTPNFNETEAEIHWMTKEEEKKDFDIGEENLPPANDANGWFLVNINENGYYRVNYQKGNWLALANQLKVDHLQISTTNRAQIINDAFKLATAGHIQIDVALKTTEYLGKEREWVPLSAARSELTYIGRMLSLDSLNGPWRAFRKSLAQEPWDFFGLNNAGASHTESYARAGIAGDACAYEIQACLDSASAQYRQYMNNPSVNPIDPNLKLTVYCNAIRNGGWDEWNFALERYKAATVATEKSLLLSAMSCTKSPWILNNYMNMILEKDSAIRAQDALTVVNLVSRNDVGRPLAWDFFRSNYDTLYDSFGSSSFSWGRVITTVTADFNTQFKLDEVESFKASKLESLGSGARAFDQAVETIRSNMKWMETNVPVIKSWLEANN